MQFPAGHPCTICGKVQTSRGFRLQGLISRLPEHRRFYLWACGDHLAEVEAKVLAAAGSSSPRQDAKSVTGLQGKLF